MAVTETTKEGWGSRLGAAFKGVLVGLALFVGGFPVLFFNEGNTVKTAKALDEGEAACISVDTNETIDPEMEGKLVHMSGKADTQDVLTDALFGVSGTAIRLKRTVEMYQWKEDSHTTEKKNVGGSVTRTTTYDYKKVWSEELFDSSEFKESGHENPVAKEFEDETWEATSVTFGAFRLSPEQIRNIGGGKPFVFPQNFTCAVERVKVQGATIYVPNAETRQNALNNRDVVSQPRIGDMRVTFEVVTPHDVSLVAKQHGDTFVAYTAKNGKKVMLLSNGIKDASELFADAQSANKTLCWIVRLVGFLMMLFGLSMVLKPISVLGDVLPILGDILEIGVGLVAFIIAAPCALVTIAVAWLFYRPVMAIVLLALAGGIVFWGLSKRKAKKAAAGTEPPPPAA